MAGSGLAGKGNASLAPRAIVLMCFHPERQLAVGRLVPARSVNGIVALVETQKQMNLDSVIIDGRTSWIVRHGIASVESFD